MYPLVIKNRDSVKSNNFSVRTNSIDFYSTDETELFTNRTINLTKNSGSNSITVDVSENAFQLLLKVNCHLESGTIDVEIYDPENTKVGEFSLDGNIKYKENKGWGQDTQGSINKKVVNPLAGEWTIKIKTETATGILAIQTNQE